MNAFYFKSRNSYKSMYCKEVYIDKAAQADN